MYIYICIVCTSGHGYGCCSWICWYVKTVRINDWQKTVNEQFWLEHAVETGCCILQLVLHKTHEWSRQAITRITFDLWCCFTLAGRDRRSQKDIVLKFKLESQIATWVEGSMHLEDLIAASVSDELGLARLWGIALYKFCSARTPTIAALHDRPKLSSKAASDPQGGHCHVEVVGFGWIIAPLVQLDLSTCRARIQRAVQREGSSNIFLSKSKTSWLYNSTGS